MFLLFRKLRRKLITGNKITSYLRYAFGEIFLVVVGIVIAIQIDDANEARKLRESASKHLEILKQDLKEDLATLLILKKDLTNQRNSLLRLLNEQKRVVAIGQEIFEDLTAVQIELSFKTRKNGLNFLVNSGELGALTDKLQNQIANYYASIELITDRETISNSYIRDKYEGYMIANYSSIYGKANSHPFQQTMYANDKREANTFNEKQFLNDRPLEMLLFGRYYQTELQLEAYNNGLEELNALMKHMQSPFQ